MDETKQIKANGALVEMGQPFEVQKVTYPVTELKLTEVEKRFADFQEDLSIKENYLFIKGGVKEVKKLITGTEARRKELKSGALDYGRKVDAAAKTIKERLDGVYQPMLEAKTTFDTAAEIAKREADRKEEERLDGISLKIEGLKNIVSDNILSSSAVLKESISTVENDSLDWSEEKKEDAVELKSAALAKLNELLNMKLQAENAAKNEAEREEAEKEKQKALQLENAKIAADNAKQAEVLKAAQEKLDKEKVDIEEEKQRLRDEAAKKIADAKLEEERKAREIREAAEKKEREERVKLLQAREEAAAKEREAKEKKEKEEREAKEAAAKKKADLEAAENLDKNICSMVDALMGYCISRDTAADLLDGIRKNNFKNLRWV